MQNDQVSNIAAAAIFLTVENQPQKYSVNTNSQPKSSCDSIGSNAADQALLREMATLAEDLQKKSSPQDLEDFADLAGDLQGNDDNSIFKPAQHSYNNNNNGNNHWSGDRTNDVRNLLQQIVNGGGNGQMAEEKMALKLLRDAMGGGSSDLKSQLRDLLNMAGGNNGGNNGGYGNYNNNGYGGNNGGYGNYNNNGYGGNNGGYGNYNNNNSNNSGGVNYGSVDGDCGDDNGSGNDNGSSNFANDAYSNLLQKINGLCNQGLGNSGGGQLGNLLNGLMNRSNGGGYGNHNNNGYGGNSGAGQLSNLLNGLSNQQNILDNARYGNHNNNGGYGNYNNGGSNHVDDMLRSIVQDDCGDNSSGDSNHNGAYETDKGFDFSSWGDPHITTKLDGKEKTTDRKEDNANFNTVYNTNGGKTRVGTIETPEKNGVTFNDQVNVHHSGRDEWHVNSDRQDDGSVKTTVSDKNGDHVLQDGESVIEGDGSKISQKGGKVSVEQATTGGGKVTTEITNNGQGLDVHEKGEGHVVVGGQAATQAKS